MTFSNVFAYSMHCPVPPRLVRRGTPPNSPTLVVAMLFPPLFIYSLILRNIGVTIAVKVQFGPLSFDDLLECFVCGRVLKSKSY